MSINRFKKFAVTAAMAAAVVFTGASHARAQEGVHTATIDIGPTLAAFGINSMVELLMTPVDGVDNWGYGFGLQYEYSLNPKTSVLGRFAILGIGIGVEGEDALNEKFELGMTAFVIEGHGRFYPTEKSFFLDGHLGYGNFGIDAKISDNFGNEEVGTSKGYITLGGRLGWRKVFNSGFVLEYTLIGYDFAFGMGKFKGLEDEKELDKVLTLFGSVFFLGGPRTSLSLGWHF